MKDKVKVRTDSLLFIKSDHIYIPVGFYHFLKITCDELLIPCQIELNYPPLKVDDSILYSSDLDDQLHPLREKFLKRAILGVTKGTGGILTAPPAFGKTYLLCTLSQVFPEAKIDIISSRRDVIFTAKKYFQEHGIKVGIVTSGHRKFERITLYTINSIHHCPFVADLVILDEAHELVTDRIFMMLMNYKNSRILALTATPNTRYDNRHKRLEALAGPLLFWIGYQDTVQSGLNVPIVVFWHEVKEGYVPIWSNAVSRKRYGLWHNDHFNKKVAEIAKKYFDEKKQVLILVDKKEHAKKLSEFLPEFVVCYGTGKRSQNLPTISKSKRDEIRTKFEKREILGVIATKIWSTGVSFNDLEVLIRADCTGSHTESIQIPGRVSRIAEISNKQFGIVVDFIPTFDERLRKQALRRRSYYRKYGYYQILPDGQILKPEIPGLSGT